MSKTLLALAALAAALVGSPALADDDEQLHAAQTDLRSARDHLKAANRDYGGHREQALHRVTNALEDIDAALKVAGRHDKHEEKKVEHIDKKIGHLENQKKKLGGAEASPPPSP